MNNDKVVVGVVMVSRGDIARIVSSLTHAAESVAECTGILYAYEPTLAELRVALEYGVVGISGCIAELQRLGTADPEPDCPAGTDCEVERVETPVPPEVGERWFEEFAPRLYSI